VTVLRDGRGALLMTLHAADVSPLLAAGWRPPIPITVPGRDGVTPLHGLMYRPTDFDPARRYPIVNHIYPGPKRGSVASRSFDPLRGEAQALAELGFIVVQIDGMGTPLRSRAFQLATYGRIGDNGLADQVSGMRELARRHPWIDIERVGIFGHSAGGYAAAMALLRYPDFFKVGVASAGNHDNRSYADAWASKWQGPTVDDVRAADAFAAQASASHAAGLRGRLLLAHGTMDDNVLPNHTLLLAEALIRHNKDFDLVLVPDAGHGMSGDPYVMRRRWDYFVRHLLGAEPPRDYDVAARSRAPRP
jgi:dipeptidyl aminopeptidase/acylaminoacyl peptidase